MKNNDYCHRTNSPEEIVFVEGEGFFKVDFWNGDEYQNDWYPEAGKVYWFQNPNDQSLGWEFVVGSGVLGDVYKDDTYINSWKNGYAYDKDENQIFINGKAIYNLKIFNLSDEETDGILDDVIGMYSGIKITRGIEELLATVKASNSVFKNAIPGRVTKGKSTQWEKSGGYNQAVDDFNSLEVQNTRDIPGGKIGTLSDGRTVNVRIKSSDGRPTLEIYDGKNSTKIRYNE